MSKIEIIYPSGATPIDPDELKDLIPDYISTLSELNQLEQSNIADAFIWAGKQDLEDLLSGSFILELHKKMFNQVWKWAGKIRKSNKNIGVMKENIMTDLAILIGNTKYWLENATFPISEIAVRFHHRLVQIHPFPNGNGRHARLPRFGQIKSIWKHPKKSLQGVLVNHNPPFAPVPPKPKAVLVLPPTRFQHELYDDLCRSVLTTVKLHHIHTLLLPQRLKSFVAVRPGWAKEFLVSSSVMKHFSAFPNVN